MAEALDALAAEAMHESDQRPVFLRVGCLSTGIMLDLGDASDRAVDIRRGAWRVEHQTDVEFARRGIAEPLAEPADALGTVEPLRAFLQSR